MSRASGAERRRRLAAKVAAGVVPAPLVSHFQTADIRTAVQDELAEKRKQLAAQREHARIKRWSFKPQPVPAVSHTQIQTHRP